jgi:hypothetical protein
MSESRVVERARHQLAILLHTALIDRDMAPMNLAAKTGIGEKRISSILSGTARERGDITFAELVSMFEFLSHELSLDIEAVEHKQAREAFLSREYSEVFGDQPDMFDSKEEAQP